jgi:hypothetical protein
MTATELALEKVKKLTEAQAQQLLQWLSQVGSATEPRTQPLGAVAMLGFARRFYPEPRTTAEWLKELREGES